MVFKFQTEHDPTAGFETVVKFSYVENSRLQKMGNTTKTTLSSENLVH